MDLLCIEAFQESSSSYILSVENLIVLSVFNLTSTSSNNVKLVVKLCNEIASEAHVSVDFTGVIYEILFNVPEVALCCKWPIIVKNKHVIAGLCSVVRQLVKYSSDVKIRQLLGFREACLLSCAENSVWTKFCEIDIITTVKDILSNKCHDLEKLTIPETIMRFEFHMSQPVRIHNIYKIARDINNEEQFESNVPIENLRLEHTFSEGPFMTLADVILQTCFKIFFLKYPAAIIEEKIPLISNWYKKTNKLCSEVRLKLQEYRVKEILLPAFNKESLYKGDTTHSRAKKRANTKQSSIDTALHDLKSLKDTIVNDNLPFGNEILFNWSVIPLEANPNGGSLPEKRANRKSQQLENLAKAVAKLTLNKKYKIVDFCSGSGHLGILLAIYLPNSEIILVENKETSLSRAEDTIRKLKLQNVTIVQSNLDYFQGYFDIGVSLHACGVATDLVIQNCIEKQAHFVSCPCCYGGVQNCHQLTYPRSQEFHLSLGYSNYLNLAHAADQTHTIDNVKTSQGYFCMDIVDTDRRMYAESCGYEVHLGKLQPISCTYKNNLLVGICKAKKS